MSPLRRMFWPYTATRAERFAHTASTLLALAGIVWAILAVQFFRLWLPRFAPSLSLTSTWRAILFVFGLFMTIVLAGLITSWIHFVLHRRSKRLIQSLNFRLCPRCRYDLSASPPDGACPECGRAYSNAALRELWNAAYRL